MKKIKTTEELAVGDLVQLRMNPDVVYCVKEVLDGFRVSLEYRTEGGYLASGGVQDVSLLTPAKKGVGRGAA